MTGTARNFFILGIANGILGMVLFAWVAKPALFGR
jgi:hypothetical protein